MAKVCSEFLVPADWIILGGQKVFLKLLSVEFQTTLFGFCISNLGEDKVWSISVSTLEEHSISAEGLILLPFLSSNYFLQQSHVSIERRFSALHPIANFFWNS